MNVTPPSHKRSLCARLVAAGVVAVACSSPSAALAEDSAPSAAYCNQVRARADSDSALLMWPQVTGQAIHFPASGADVALVEGKQNQARVGGTFSPLGFFKGLELQDVASADCAQHAAHARIEKVLGESGEVGKGPALREQAAYLDTQRAEWERLRGDEEKRFAARVITLGELSEILVRVSGLELKAVQARGEIARLAARGVARPVTTLGALERDYLAHADRYDSAVASVRSFDPWQVKVTGGVVPTDTPVDWYGMVDVSFSLGAFVHNHDDVRFTEAHRDELRHAPYEVVARLRELRTELDARREEARRELDVLDTHARILSSTRSAVDGSEANGSGHATATLTLDLIGVDSDRAYLRTFISELTTYLREA